MGRQGRRPRSRQSHAVGFSSWTSVWDVLRKRTCTAFRCWLPWTNSTYQWEKSTTVKHSPTARNCHWYPHYCLHSSGHGRTFFWKAIWFQTRHQHLGAFHLFLPCRTQVCSCKFGRSTRRERIRRWRNKVSAGGCVAWGGPLSPENVLRVFQSSCVCLPVQLLEETASFCPGWQQQNCTQPWLGDEKTYDKEVTGSGSAYVEQPVWHWYLLFIFFV